MTNPIRQIREGYTATKDLVEKTNANSGSWLYTNSDKVEEFTASMKNPLRILGRLSYTLTHPDKFSDFYRELNRYFAVHSARA